LSVITNISSNELQIVELLQQANTNAIALIHQHYGGALYSILKGILPTEEQAQDALQNTLVKVWKNATTYDSSKGKLFTWLINIARNTALDELKSKANKQTTQNVDIDKAHNRLDYQYSLNTNIDTIGIKKAIHHLPQDQQVILDLMYFKGFTQAEIAEKLNIPLGTIKSKIRYAITSLRQYYQS
jgi:RNA polymerase sigma-70 factor, ECF subfamily